MLTLPAGGYNYQEGTGSMVLTYRFDLVFPLLVIATYLISLLAILFAISLLIQVSSSSSTISSSGGCSSRCPVKNGIHLLGSAAHST